MGFNEMKIRCVSWNHRTSIVSEIFTREWFTANLMQLIEQYCIMISSGSNCRHPLEMEPYVVCGNEEKK